MLLSENGLQSARVRAPGLVPELPQSPCETCQVRKSNFCGALSGDRDDWVALRGQHRSTAARHTVYRAGEASEGVLLICDGWAVRFVQLPNGKRQILSVLLPGDMASPIAIGERQLAFSIQAVTEVRYCYLPPADVRARIQHDPVLFEAWMRLTTAAQRDADRRLVDLGQRTAQERIAALVVHLMARFEERGELHGDRFPFPLSQQQIADCTGLTPVHACRVLSVLRQNRICDVGHGAVKILERTELQRLAAVR
jgi:CRP-like cAMP-binding protein